MYFLAKGKKPVVQSTGWETATDDKMVRVHVSVRVCLYVWVSAYIRACLPACVRACMGECEIKYL